MVGITYGEIQRTLRSVKGKISKMVPAGTGSTKPPPTKRWDQHLEVLAVLFFMTLEINIILLNIYLLITPSTWPLYLPYLLWVFFIDYNTPKNGRGRPIKGVKDWTVWTKISQYFPVTLHKTVDLDPKRKYLFGYHPHGIICIGGSASFASTGCGVLDIFPGLTIHPTTISLNFKVPIYREILLWLGFLDVGHTSLTNALTNEKEGNAVLVVVGGASEALDAHPGTNALTLKKRKGFVRFALKTGASLVPVYGFGENNLWDQVANPQGSKIRHLQSQLSTALGFSLPIIFGRGIFNYKFGIFPHRRPVHVVVGEPIECPARPNPTKEEIDQMHERYLEGLTRLYEDHCDVFDADRKQGLSIVA